MKKISNSEFVIMNVLWQADEALNRHEIAKRVQLSPFNQTWELATVSTFITRLYQKEFIDYKKEDKIYHYYPTISRLDYNRAVIDEKIYESFGKSIEELLLEYTNNPVNEKNLQKIKDYINKLTKKKN